MPDQIYKQLNEARNTGQKWLAVLIDPENINSREELLTLLGTCSYAKVNLLLVGGSIVRAEKLDLVLQWLKDNTKLPVVLFPGSAIQVNNKADGILFLSLISGRNPDLLIGQHVLAAPGIEQSNLEVISCGYILIDGGKPTSVSYISNTIPVPADKPDIAAYTALAGEWLGLKCMYLEAGSGAFTPVAEQTIKTVRKKIKVPLFVGGGIRTRKNLLAAWEAGADVVVVGTAIEKNPDWLISEEITALQENKLK
ncbi:MAG: geranylgeranylglyceryl/heptaprenylglyceryl phosphate synthase [Flavobacteriales bacterium]